MNTQSFTILVSFLFLLLACEKEEFDLESPDVEEFVSLIKAEEYQSHIGYQLPEFKVGQIGELIGFTNDTSKIGYYPVNPISSKRTDPHIVGECLLWTIEGIRIDRKSPSLEQHLLDTTSYERLSMQELLQVSELYKKWWDSYDNNPSENVKKTPLLADTPYKWN